MDGTLFLSCGTGAGTGCGCACCCCGCGGGCRTEEALELLLLLDLNSEGSGIEVKSSLNEGNEVIFGLVSSYLALVVVVEVLCLGDGCWF